MSKNTKNLIIGILIGVFAFAIVVTGAVFAYSRFFISSSNEEVMTDEKADKKDKSSKDRKDIDDVDHISNTARHLERKMITVDYDSDAIKYNPNVAAYKPKADLSDVYDIERVYLGDEAREKLARNNFVVAYGSEAEFFDLYEFNRYAQYASFVTTDSMMHTYHLYFAMLQENTERNYLYGNIERLSKRMYDNCLAQYEELKDSEWEEASRLNTAYFAIACTLLETDIDIPEEVKETVDAEIKKINASDTVAFSEITGAMEDYSQYKPRGYYDGDELLERYFKAMMLFGHLNFAQKDETNNRCALLMTLAMDEEAYKEWDAVYEVTSFFVGASDDNGYYEYLPLIDEAYGQGISASDLIGDKKGWDRFDELTASLEAPAINSEIFADDEGKTDKNEESKGYRFMGQRFTLDAAILDKLICGNVKQADDGSKRMLPDALDIPAAMGSDMALSVIADEGLDRYPNYYDQMDKAKAVVKKADEDGYRSRSLYGGWLYTLNPILIKKGEGYPSFMTNDEWQKKSLESYLGSYTELKHDTVLYAKQAMAEMGGGDDTVYDDRGYVEPEPELYDRLYTLTQNTSDGLDKLGVISNEDKEGLRLLGELAKSLRDISIKELNNESLSDDEYELIRGYGGSLEHFWKDTLKNKTDKEYIDSREFPMALVTDIATDPNGSCLQLGIGGASTIYVIFPIDGQLHIGRGGVFNFYQFEQPISDRMTDKEWRIKLGMSMDDNDEYHFEEVEQPAWTQSYRYRWHYGD
ncbi:MAG: DUF3160 domain-containing protein [Lachnospiraceae bacterium]|nr:DUF3160 domain-containing protein [Lachnospiraceae bacterium]